MGDIEFVEIESGYIVVDVTLAAPITAIDVTLPSLAPIGVDILGVGIQGPPGPVGPEGPVGPLGPPGPGMPVGGSQGQMLIKTSSINYDTEWHTLIHVGTTPPANPILNDLWVDTT